MTLWPVSSWFFAFWACTGADPDTGTPAADAGPQALERPDDPGERGMPVGVRTVEHDGVTLEVWYPADDAHVGQAGDPVSLQEFLPASFEAHVGPVTLPSLPSVAVRDAAPRPLEAPVPVVLFSHGFGGFRVQSQSLTSHLAGRGFVVVAPDHPGRMMGDVLPCLFNPPLDGCDLSGFVDDPGPDDLAAALDWVSGDPSELAGLADATSVAVVGHSAGAGSATTFASDETRVAAVLPMAGGAATAQPTLYMGGTCDPYPGIAAIEAARADADAASLVAIVGAGHLAFSDLCALDLAALADEVLAGRDDLSAIYYDQLLALGTDGCPGRTPDPEQVPGCSEYLPLDQSDPIIRHYATAFLDEVFRQSGPGIESDRFPDAQVVTP